MDKTGGATDGATDSEDEGLEDVLRRCIRSIPLSSSQQQEDEVLDNPIISGFSRGQEYEEFIPVEYQGEDYGTSNQGELGSGSSQDDGPSLSLSSSSSSAADADEDDNQHDKKDEEETSGGNNQ
ncbi:uncharacterized protein LOC121856256 [Homarus americanus]|uniref:Uncharacterized protein n=1 Tax=Homarus americanus TaxID=6706 RepID=A0A8J5NAI4_HOMAM|nr:uncharacterized protein LOC121856256 [Homarus americanus]XP_042207592.1 uncharacterized protein LOC121856256 [Homarus americanus]XP_042207602.1 uncharacterized protein LOC121856256 [Homarus americanus]KAG7175834.1 hypothetical protein Hamer_G009857 [Homarus americanus]